MHPYDECPNCKNGHAAHQESRNDRQHAVRISWDEYAPPGQRVAVDKPVGNVGLKHDQGKPRTDLLPSGALMGTAAVFEYGSRKYSANNWRLGIPLSRLIDALLRHTFAFMGGEDNDPESGLPHLDHALCSLMMLRETWHDRKDLDDRWKPEQNKEK